MHDMHVAKNALMQTWVDTSVFAVPMQNGAQVRIRLDA